MIPAGISDLKKLKQLSVGAYALRSLPKELGALSQLELLDVSMSKALGAANDDVAFPPELEGLKSLRELHLAGCGLRRVPAFDRELSSLDEIWLNDNRDLQFDAPLDYLIECCPHLRVVDMQKDSGGTWTQQSLAHLEAFEEKLQKKNASAEVEF